MDAEEETDDADAAINKLTLADSVESMGGSRLGSAKTRRRKIVVVSSHAAIADGVMSETSLGDKSRCPSKRF